MFTRLKAWLGASQEPARSTCAARLMAAATDHQHRIDAAKAQRDAAYEREDYREFARLQMVVQQAKTDQLAHEVWG